MICPRHIVEMPTDALASVLLDCPTARRPDLIAHQGSTPFNHAAFPDYRLGNELPNKSAAGQPLGVVVGCCHSLVLAVPALKRSAASNRDAMGKQHASNAAAFVGGESCLPLQLAGKRRLRHGRCASKG